MAPQRKRKLIQPGRFKVMRGPIIEDLKQRIFSTWQSDRSQSPAEIAHSMMDRGDVRLLGLSIDKMIEISSGVLQNITDSNHKKRPRRAGRIKDPQRPESEKAKAYQALITAVSTVHASLGKASQIQPNSLLLDETRLVEAATAPASSDKERSQAVAIIQAFKLDVVDLFEGLLETEFPDSARRLNAATALARLGRREALEAIRREGRVGLKPRILSWQVLPPGWWNNPKYTDHVGIQWKHGNLILERLRFVDSLGPVDRYVGNDKFGSYTYWAFVFESHVVAECPLEGNAIYVIRGTEDWKTLLAGSKRNLLTTAPGRVRRILHRGEWKSRLRQALSSRF